MRVVGALAVAGSVVVVWVAARADSSAGEVAAPVASLVPPDPGVNAETGRRKCGAKLPGGMGMCVGGVFPAAQCNRCHPHDKEREDARRVAEEATATAETEVQAHGAVQGDDGTAPVSETSIGLPSVPLPLIVVPAWAHARGARGARRARVARGAGAACGA